MSKLRSCKDLCPKGSEVYLRINGMIWTLLTHLSAAWPDWKLYSVTQQQSVQDYGSEELGKVPHPPLRHRCKACGCSVSERVRCKDICFYSSPLGCLPLWHVLSQQETAANGWNSNTESFWLTFSRKHATIQWIGGSLIRLMHKQTTHLFSLFKSKGKSWINNILRI